MATINDLVAATNDFCIKFCNSKLNFPSWNTNDIWEFDGTIKDGNKRGCYALLRGEEIIYVGVGIGHSTETYKGSGLGDRLKNYWIVNKGKSGEGAKMYRSRDNWSEINGIITIGFDEENYFLAAALEVYLITKLMPLKNRVHNSKDVIK